MSTKKTKTTKTKIVYDTNDKIVEKIVEIVEVEETTTIGDYPNYWSHQPVVKPLTASTITGVGSVSTSGTIVDKIQINTNPVINQEELEKRVQEAIERAKKEWGKGKLY